MRRTTKTKTSRRRPAPRKPKAPPRAPRKTTGGYVLPPLDLLAAPKAIGRATCSATTRCRPTPPRSKACCSDFGVRGEIINARPGPVVTLYELEPAPGIKSSRVIGLADDIARSMSALSARVAVVAGTQRHRHRTAEPDAREGLSCASCSPATTTTTPPRSCRSASARPSAANRSSSISRACRIC